MDRKPAAARLLILGLAALALTGAGAADLSVLRAARWLAPGADRVSALGAARPECLVRPADPDRAYAVEVGRAAFRTPMLLGGQAARAGVACETCHQGGRSNPDFFFPGLSGAPGTADVTSALFSSHRDDGLDNPKPIPDLSGPKDRLKVSQDPANGALERFIHGLITEEFDGAEPPAGVMRGLGTYVRALSPAACPTDARRALTPALYVDNARRAVRAAAEALRRKDSATAAFMVEAARAQLGLLYERFDQPVSMRPRTTLKAADQDLVAILAAIRAGDAKGGERLAVWLADSKDWAGAVQAAAPQSLFNPRRLAAAAKPDGTGAATR